VTADPFAEELASIARELAAPQVSAWADVLASFPLAEPEVESALVRSTPGAPGTTARRLLLTWQEHAPSLPGAALALALRAAGQVHAQAERQRSSLVVSGPIDFAVPARLTRPAACEVVTQARKTLLIVSFATHGMGELIAELHAAADRGVTIDFVLESSRKQGGTLISRSSGESVFASLHDRAKFWHWPSKQRLLGRFTTRDSRAALHAKVITADARIALVSSANLTDRGYTRNLEIGVTLRDPAPVVKLEKHFRKLMDNGTLSQIEF